MAHHHKEIPASKPFKMSSSYTKSFVGMIIVGALLILGGWGLTKIGGDEHASGHHGTEHHQDGDHDGHHPEGNDVDSHGKPGYNEDKHDGAHSDASGKSVFQFTQHTGDDHGHDASTHDHEDGHNHSGEEEHTNILDGEEHHEDGVEHLGEEVHGENRAHGDYSEDEFAPAGTHHGGEQNDHGPHDGHAMEDHIMDGTWRRAYVHEEQTYIYDENGRAVMTPDGHYAHNGAHHEVNDLSQFGSSLLAGSFWWLCIALFGVFFIAVGYVANAGWYIVLKRIMEPFYKFLPIAALLLVIVFFAFGEHVWDWRFYHLNQFDENGNQILFDHLIDHKSPMLNWVFALGVLALIVGLWTFFGHMFRKNSLAEEKVGGLEYHKKSIRFSAMFLPIFGLGFSLVAFSWIMSLEPHWFSTIFAVYCFAGLFVSGAMITILIAMHMKERGHLNVLSSYHVHDMGKFIFAFSVFWAYVWVSQFLLIWYANIPEETIYYFNRFENYYFLFAANVALNFIFPFLALMMRSSKEKHLSLRSVIRVMLVGRFFDVFLLVAPGALGAEWGVGDVVMYAGSFVMIGGVFLMIVFRDYEKASLTAEKHPYFEESVYHSTGI